MPSSARSSYPGGQAIGLPPNRVQMQVIDRLAGVGADVGDDAVAVREAELLGKVAADEEEMFLLYSRRTRRRGSWRPAKPTLARL